MKFLITGAAGFIGSSLCVKLLERGDSIIGIDNHNDYYDPKIKEARLERLKEYSNYKHYRLDLFDKESLENVLLKYTIDHHNFSNYNSTLNINYTNLKKNLKKQIFLNIFYKYKNNQLNLTCMQ